MKEKRYFCDYWFGTGGSVKIPIIIILVSLIVIILVSSLVCYNVLLSKHGNELNSYSESTYQYLDEIADNVIQEGTGIDFLALPDDIVKYEITNQDNGIIFKYYLDNNKGSEFAVSANMTVELSDNFEIISKEPNYTSEEDYVSDIKGDMIWLSFMIGVMIWVGVIIVALIVCTIVAYVSKANKKKNLS